MNLHKLSCKLYTLVVRTPISLTIAPLALLYHNLKSQSVHAWCQCKSRLSATRVNQKLSQTQVVSRNVCSCCLSVSLSKSLWSFVTSVALGSDPLYHLRLRNGIVRVGLNCSTLSFQQKNDYSLEWSAACVTHQLVETCEKSIWCKSKFNVGKQSVQTELHVKVFDKDNIF